MLDIFNYRTHICRPLCVSESRIHKQHIWERERVTSHPVIRQILERTRIIYNTEAWTWKRWLNALNFSTFFKM